MAGTVKAHLAGRGIQRHYLHALLESADSGTNFFDYTREFVSEQGGRNDHAGVVAALIYLEVGAASQSDLHLHQYLAILDMGDGNLLNFYVLFAVEDSCCHLSVHCCLSCEPLLPTILTESRSSLIPAGDGWPTPELPQPAPT